MTERDERAARLAEQAQLLVATHSPQVAARGHAHWKVMKADKAGLTTTTVVALDETRRREEIARMLSGAEITDDERFAMELLHATGVAGHGSRHHPENAVTRLAEAVAALGRTDPRP